MDSYDRIISKIDRIQDRLNQIEVNLNDSMIKLQNVFGKLAIDVPIGSKLSIDGTVVEVVAYSKFNHELVVAENMNGVRLVNVNHAEIIR